ncbi:MAG: L-lactate dehydrogenase [Eubacteriales bacterium]
MKTAGRKIAIIGVGSVGASVAYALAVTGVANELVLVDINRRRAEGEAMDLAHAAAFIKPVEIYAGDYVDCRNASIIVFTAGVNQKPGETRIDLLQNNYTILKDTLPGIMPLREGAVLLVVANPVDVMTYAALKITGLAPERVFGSGTVLDSSRFRHALSRYLGVAPRNIHAYVVGEHGDSEVFLWSHAYVAGTGIDDYCRLAGLKPVDREAVDRSVRKAGYEIIARKGATYYAISIAVKQICEAILRDENTILTVSGLINGSYGIEGCCLSLPCLLNAGGKGRLLELLLSPEERKALLHSAEILREAIGSLKL